MVVHAPFVRWDLDWDASSTKPRAGIYYLETAQGQRVDCVAGISRQGKHNTYKPFDGFLQEYHNILPLSTALEWNFRCQLAAWLDGIIYHSFLWYNEQGVEHYWSLSSIDVPQEFEVRFKEVFRIYVLEEMVIRMADRTWTMAIDNLRLDAQTFRTLWLKHLKLLPL